MTDPTTGEIGELIERLRRKVQVTPAIGGGSICADGTSTWYTTDDGYRLANPDGPEAADTLSAYQDRIERLEEALGQMVSAWEALPGPHHYSVSEVQKWLVGPMTQAINNLRLALTDTTKE